MQLIRHPKDFWTGVLFIALGGGAALIALDYSFGSAGRMGPGYFPRWLGLLLALLGAILIARSLKIDGEKLSFPTFVPLGVVLASVFVFGIAVKVLGFVIATILLVVIASMASHEYRWKESVMAALALAGLPATERDRIGGRFYRVPGTSGPGSGLGLSIVNEIARLYRGRLVLEGGAQGTGLRARLIVPRVGETVGLSATFNDSTIDAIDTKALNASRAG